MKNDVMGTTILSMQSLCANTHFLLRPGILMACTMVLLSCCQRSGNPGELPPQDSPPFDFGNQPMRYLENGRMRLGINLAVGGAVTFLEDKSTGGGNMINSHDWGRQIQLSYYSGPAPFFGPNGEAPAPQWVGLGWNPIQSGSVGKIPSKVVAFEQGRDFMRVVCIPMQWPLKNVPGDCMFEVTYRIVETNAISMESRIVNRRQDKTQYPARHQEMPALYTNGAWYRLVTYQGEKPFSHASPTTVVDKADGKGWPWSYFYAPEHWAALVNREGFGVGLYQPDTAQMIGGFAGGDAKKGGGSPTDFQAGYLAPIASRILDADIDWTYRTHIIVGSLDEIRAFAEKQPRHVSNWDFASDRHGWFYENARDSGWPIRDGLNVRFGKSPRGTMSSDIMCWKAQEAPALEIEASFGTEPGAETLTAEAVIQPFGLEDGIDWVNPAPEQKRKDFPPAPLLRVPFQVHADGVLRVYRVPLSQIHGYSGAMKQLSLWFPAVAGTACVRRITLVPVAHVPDKTALSGEDKR